MHTALDIVDCLHSARLITVLMDLIFDILKFNSIFKVSYITIAYVEIIAAIVLVLFALVLLLISGVIFFSKLIT
jgi:hypothetical protein